MLTCFEDLLSGEPIRQAKVGPFRRFKRQALRHLLNSAGKKLEESFDGKPVVEASIRVDLADMYLALHESTKAQEHLQRAEESLRLADGSPAEIVQDLQRKLSQTRKRLEHLADSSASKQEK